MKVLVVHSRYRSPSGEEAVVERELALLVAAGHDARLIEFENGRGARSVVDLALAPHNPVAARRVGQEIATFRPDVVHVHNTWFAASPSVMSVARQRSTPVVATLHNYRSICAGATLLRDGVQCTDCLDGSVLPGLRHRCVNGSAVQSLAGSAVVLRRRRGERHGSLADRYIAPTQVLADWIERGGVPRDRLTVLPHFAPDPGPPDTVPSRSRVVLYAGRLSAEKGIETAIEAWSRMADRPADARFVVAGEGPLEEALRSRNVPGVEFLGRVGSDAVGPLIASARFIVVPSVWSEPFGLVYLEAMARGVGILSSRMGGAESFLADGGGWLVTPGDAGEWAREMSALLADDSEADGRVDTAGRLARSTFEASYSPGTHLDALLDIYRSVIALHR